MKKNEDIENIIKKLVQENPEQMERLDSIDDAVFDRIENRVRYEVSQNSAGKKRFRPRTFLNIAAAVLAFAAVFSLALYFMEMPRSSAENPAATSVPEGYVPDADGEELFINLPKFIPDGYIVTSISVQPKLSFYGANIRYENKTEKDLFIEISIEGNRRLDYPLEFEREIEELEHNGMPLIITTIKSEPVMIHAYFSEGSHGLGVEILATVDRATLFDIMDSMQ